MKALHGLKVQGVLLAGLNGWSESGLELFCGRPLLPVAGRPLIEYGFNWLRRGGASHVSICTDGYVSAFRRLLSDQAGASPAVEFHADILPRGTAGCLFDAAAVAEADLLLAVEGAIIPWLDPEPLIQAHLKSGAGLTVVAAEGETCHPAYPNMEPVGAYVVSREALKHVPARKYQDIKEMWIPRLHEKGVMVRPHVVAWRQVVRVTGAASYLAANEAVLVRSAASRACDPEYHRTGSAWVHVTAHIDPTAQLCGPVLIGPGARVGPGARILGPTTIGTACRIDRDAVIVHSALWPGCRVERRAIVNHSILAARSNVEAELILRDCFWVPDSAGSPPEQEHLYWPAPQDLAAWMLADQAMAPASEGEVAAEGQGLEDTVADGFAQASPQAEAVAVGAAS